jgi:hypothetical protein
MTNSSWTSVKFIFEHYLNQDVLACGLATGAVHLYDGVDWNKTAQLQVSNDFTDLLFKYRQFG